MQHAGCMLSEYICDCLVAQMCYVAFARADVDVDDMVTSDYEFEDSWVPGAAST